VAESPEPAAAEEGAGPVRLAQRLAAIRAEAFGIGKENVEMQKDGKKWTIRGHTVEAVLSEMRPLLLKHGVGLTPNLFERTYSGNRCDVIVDFQFEALTEPFDTRIVRWAGAGTDNGDKAFAKAGTNALKEMLKKLFLITDRDDAKEEEEVVEHQTADQVSRAELEKAKEAARANLERWAVTARAAFMSAKTLDEVKALERENKDQLTSADMPPATRAFFAQLIEDRKRALAPEKETA
jgi:hypothetical protein